MFHREGWGEIDLIWGDVHGGVGHILGKHVGEGKSFATKDEAIKEIDNIISNGVNAFENGDKAVFKIGSKLVTVRKNWREHGKKKADKNWVLTAYDEEAADGDMSAIATANRGQAAQTTANSTDKVSDFSSNLQGKGGKKSAMGGDSEGAMEPRQTERENAVEAGTAAPRLSEKEVRRGVKDHVRKWNGVLNEDNIETVGDAMRWVYAMAAETRRQYSRETGHKMGLDYSRLLDKDDSHGRKIDTSKAKYYLTHIEAMAERMKERLESAIAKTKSDAPRRALEETLAELERTVKWYRRAANGDVSYSLAFCNVAFFRDVGFGVGHMVCLMGCCNAAAYRTRG